VMTSKAKMPLSRCFISASADVNTQVLISLLKSKGVCSIDAYTVSRHHISPSVEDEIESSDFLLAVFSPKTPNPNVLYEIGFAKGAKKPIFLIVQDEGAIPQFLTETVYVRSSLGDRQLISFYLDQFLSKQEESVKKVTLWTKKPSLKLDKANLEKQLESIREQGAWMTFLQLVKDLFESQGFIVDASNSMMDKGADMSIWVDSLESSFGNPILVELKMGNLSERVLKTAEEQMRSYLNKTNARSGLLIYFDRRGRRFCQSKLQLPLVIRLSISDLIEKSAERPIDRVLLRERNRVAHGG
jgi:nucleoside 2-deoxyribosyltransferase